VCALCIEKKKTAPSRRGKQTTYKCKQCDLPLCRVGCFFWNTTSCEIR
jgi:predicted RNA-binding protein with PUA domain